MITDATLAGAQNAGMLYAIALENLDRSIIHNHRYGNYHLSLRFAKDGVNACIQVETLGHVVDLCLDRLPEIPWRRFDERQFSWWFNVHF
jgi:hypothetical protein